MLDACAPSAAATTWRLDEWRSVLVPLRGPTRAGFRLRLRGSVSLGSRRPRGPGMPLPRQSLPFRVPAVPHHWKSALALACGLSCSVVLGDCLDASQLVQRNAEKAGKPRDLIPRPLGRTVEPIVQSGASDADGVREDCPRVAAHKQPLAYSLVDSAVPCGIHWYHPFLPNWELDHEQYSSQLGTWQEEFFPIGKFLFCV